MKKILFLLLITYALPSIAQKKITADNYYSFLRSFKNNSLKGMKGNMFTRDWLADEDIEPVIIEELTKAGFDSLNNTTVFHMEDGTELKLAAYSKSSNIGFYYINGHYAEPKKEHRAILFLNQKPDSYLDNYKSDVLDEYDLKKIKELPPNIFILKEDCYFFEYSNNPADDKLFVSKADAIRILRHDVKAYLVYANKKAQKAKD